MNTIKRIFVSMIFMILTLSGLYSMKKKPIPGLETVKRVGTKLTAVEVFNKIGDILLDMGATGRISYLAYQASLEVKNEDPVFIIDAIEVDKNNIATKIEGHIEVPSTFKEYVSAGGLGVPIYEAKEPNEFGQIFGRKGDVAVRDGVIVKINPLETEEIYEVILYSEMYDKINRASLLFNTYEVVRTPFLKNLIIELEGRILNAASRDEILNGIKEFKKKNRRMSDEEVLINYLAVNKSYLQEIKKSEKESKARVKEGREMLDAISTACSLQIVDITKLYAEMTAEIVLIVLNPKEAPGKIASYMARNFPKNSTIRFKDLQEVQNYNKYLMDNYSKNRKVNQELWKKVNEIIKELY